jgi:hypothetical protein
MAVVVSQRQFPTGRHSGPAGVCPRSGEVALDVAKLHRVDPTKYSALLALESVELARSGLPVHTAAAQAYVQSEPPRDMPLALVVLQPAPGCLCCLLCSLCVRVTVLGLLCRQSPFTDA